jgi:hypothetical protein
MKTIATACLLMALTLAPASAGTIYTDTPIRTYRTTGMDVTFSHSLYRIFGMDQGE